MATSIAYLRQRDRVAAEAALKSLDLGGMTTLFLPVVSIAQERLVGLEAVGCGLTRESMRRVDPREILRGHDTLQARRDLDRVFRARGMEGFLGFRKGQPDLVLFLNVDGAVLTKGFAGSGHLDRMVRESAIDPSSVVVVVGHSPGMDPDTVKRYLDRKRALGYLVAMGNVEATREGIHRAFLAQPDLVLLEKPLAQGLSRDPARRGAVHAVVRLARERGALVAVDGVENEEDALAALEAGADFLQGPYFARPQGEAQVLGIKSKIRFLASRCRRRRAEQGRGDWDHHRGIREIGDALMAEVEGRAAGGLGERFSEMVRRHPALQCVYLLDQDGFQVGEAVRNPRIVPACKRHLFEISPMGTDHSGTPHYEAIARGGAGRYFGEPANSVVTGLFCETFAGLFRFSEGERPFILCADIDGVS